MMKFLKNTAQHSLWTYHILNKYKLYLLRFLINIIYYMATLKKSKKFNGLYLEALPKKPIKSRTPQPEATVDADDIKRQAQPTVNALNQNAQDEFDDMELEDIGGPIGNIEQYEQTDLPTFNYKSLALYINFAYNSKQPLLIYGDPGIGKSEVVKGITKQIAESKSKQYVNWSEVSTAQKLEVLKNPGQYFVLIDVRANKLEPTDFVGIPDISSQAEYLETKQLKWIYFMSQPEADGILFLDEVNQASPQVLRALYEVVNDRSAGGTPFSKDFTIVAAGNLGGEFEEPIPQALTNRFTAGVLIADPEGWLKWAEKSGIDIRIIAFVKAEPGANFYAKPKNSDDPFPTPRQLTKLSTKLKKLYAYYGKLAKEGKSVEVPIYKAIGDQAAALCGVFWARKFLVFLKHIRAFDFKTIIKNVNTLSKESQGNLDKLHALVVFVVGKLRIATSGMLKDPNQPNPNDVEILEGVFKISNALNKEWALILWNVIKRELPQPNFEETLKFSIKGNYDSATKTLFTQNTLPELKRLLAS